MEILQNWLIDEKFLPLEHTEINVLNTNILSSSYLAKIPPRQYVIKVLNADAFMKLYQLNLKDLTDQLNNQEHVIATASHNKFLVPKVIMLNKKKAYTPYKNYLIYVTEFVEGKILGISSYTSMQIYQVGTILAKIHATDLLPFDFKIWENKKNTLLNILSLFHQMYDPEKTKRLLNHYLNSEDLFPYIDKIAQRIGVVMEEFYQDVTPENKNHLVLSHYDIKPKNILWKNDKEPIILDWDTLFIVRRSYDYLGTLLAFSTQISDNGSFEFHQENVTAFKHGYQSIDNREIAVNDQDILTVAFNELHWLQQNVIVQNHQEVKNSLLFIKFLRDQTEEIKKL